MFLLYFNKREVKSKMCKWLGWLLPIIVIIFTFWEIGWSKWVVLVAALIMLWYGAKGNCCTSEAKPVKNKKKK